MNTKVKADPANHKISVQNANGGSRMFDFDHIIEQSRTQDELYSDAKISDLVARVLDGFHSTIFAYGQTGSGKTYSMEGKHENGVYPSDQSKGLVARTLDDLFSQIATLRSHTNKVYNVTCSFLQIYNEKIYDLLCNYSGNLPTNSNGTTATAAAAAAAVATIAPQGLKLRWNAREQFQVENLFVFDVKSSKDAINYFLQGIKNRVVASHKLNMQSSRSHTMFTITVNAYTAEGAHETSSKMQLVDLAGSERIALTGTEGKTAKESIDINKSLFTLRQVITALSEMNNPHTSFNQTNAFHSTINHHNNHSNQNSQNQSPDARPASSSKHHQLFSTTLTSGAGGDHSNKLHHIPYRESKLTSLLKQSIGGNSYCLMLACIVPNDAFVDEIISTLHYATRATFIRNQPVKNEDPNKQKISEITQENSNIKAELDKANAHIAFLTQELQKSEMKLKAMKAKCQCASNTSNGTQVTSPDDYNNNNISSTGEVTPNIHKASNSQYGTAKAAAAAAAAAEILTKEQIQLMQQQELFKSQRNQQEQHSRMMEDRMSRISKQIQENEIMRQTTSTNFVQALNFETARQTGIRFAVAPGGGGVTSSTSSALANTHSQLQLLDSRNSTTNKPYSGATPSHAQLSSTSREFENQQLSHQLQQQQQQQQSLSLSNGCNSGEYENFSQRLIESITLVRSLLESNKELRQQTDDCRTRMREQETEIELLISENQILQERIDMFLNKETIEANNSNEGSNGTVHTNTTSTGNTEEESRTTTKSGQSRETEDDATSMKPPSSHSSQSSSNANAKTAGAVQQTTNNITITSLDLRAQSKNELIQEILELRHNQKVLEHRIKCIDLVDKSPSATASATKNGNAPAGAAAATAIMNSTNSRFNSIFQSRASNHATSMRGSSLQNHPTSRMANVSASLTINHTNDTLTGQSSVLEQTLSSFAAAPHPSVEQYGEHQPQGKAYTNRQSALEQFTTNFGRYTFYSQSLHNGQQQQAAVGQSNSAGSSSIGSAAGPTPQQSGLTTLEPIKGIPNSVRSPAPYGKIASNSGTTMTPSSAASVALTGGNSTSSASNYDTHENILLNEVNTNHVKKSVVGPLLPSAAAAAAAKNKNRSSSMNNKQNSQQMSSKTEQSSFIFYQGIGGGPTPSSGSNSSNNAGNNNNNNNNNSNKLQAINANQQYSSINNDENVNSRHRNDRSNKAKQTTKKSPYGY